PDIPKRALPMLLACIARTWALWREVRPTSASAIYRRFPRPLGSRSRNCSRRLRDGLKVRGKLLRSEQRSDGPRPPVNPDSLSPFLYDSCFVTARTCATLLHEKKGRG